MSAPPALAIGGDVILGQRQAALTAHRGPANALNGIPELATADLALVTLECVVAASGERVSLKRFAFRGRPELLVILASAGIDVVATANNHSGDYGRRALRDQGKLLDAMQLAHCGSGINRKAACAPVMRRAGNLTVAVFSIDGTSPTYAASAHRAGNCYRDWSSPRRWRRFFARRIRAARKRAHIIVVVVHYGIDFSQRPPGRDIRICRALIKAGADVVVRTSTHVPQGVEIFRGRPILYDPGTLLWGAPGHRSTEAAVYSLILAPEGVRQLWVTPIEVGDGASRSADGPRAQEILTLLRERSSELGTTLRNIGSRGLIDLPPLPPRKPPTKSVAATTPVGSPPQPLTVAPPFCEVMAVPATAEREPTAIGPLTLIGLTATRGVTLGPPVYLLDSYWTMSASTAEDLWLSAGLQPPRRQPGEPGWSDAYDPCDAQWPTSRWLPGVIYRDRTLLRTGPGAVASVGSSLTVWIGVYGWDDRLGLIQTTVEIEDGHRSVPTRTR